jgi:hypothetical protein
LVLPSSIWCLLTLNEENPCLELGRSEEKFGYIFAHLHDGVSRIQPIKGVGTLKNTSELAQNGQKVGTVESSNSLRSLVIKPERVNCEKMNQIEES